MFRCPKCHAELPPDARYCNKCGFNHTNAMKAVSPPQTGPGGMPSAPSGAPGSQSLTRRYAGNQPPQQQGPMPSGGQMQPGEQIVRTSTPPPPRTASGVMGQPARGPQGPAFVGPQGGPMSYGQQGMNQPVPPAYPPAAPPVALSVESLAATSQAAEHWRNSWRDRQRAEAGPAVGISRGQAVVPEPLMVMQQSLARMRSIIMPNTQEKEATPAQKLLYRISSILLFCLIVGLGGYLISSFIPRTLVGAYPSGSIHSAYPSISIPVTAKNTSPAVKPGQALTISGDSFKPNSTITFSLGTTALNATATTGSKGQFGIDIEKPPATVTIPSNQLPGSYVLTAQDKATNQQATMHVQVLPNGAVNNTSLQLSDDQGAAVKSLSFNTANGDDPKSQVLTITNTGTAKATWSASIVTQNAQNWISLNASNATNAPYGKVGGEIDPGGTDTVAVGVSSANLASLFKKAYQGYVIFTVGQNQLILPVSFAVQNKSLDVVVTPNPLTVISNGDGTCKPTTLAIINNSDVTITWNVSATNGNIQLSQKSSQLTPAGGGTDAVTIDVTCSNIQQPADNFSVINVFFNGHQVSVTVNVRAN
jgi:zinc-ribbon domain